MWSPPSPAPQRTPSQCWYLCSAQGHSLQLLVTPLPTTRWQARELGRAVWEWAPLTSTGSQRVRAGWFELSAWHLPCDTECGFSGISGPQFPPNSVAWALWCSYRTHGMCTTLCQARRGLREKNHWLLRSEPGSQPWQERTGCIRGFV